MSFRTRSLADYSFLFGPEARKEVLEATGVDDADFIKELEHFSAWFRVHHDIETKKTRTGDFKSALETMRSRTESLLESLHTEDPLFFTALSNIDLDLLLELQGRLRDVRDGTESALRSIRTIRLQGRQILFSHRELAASIAAILAGRGMDVTESSEGALSRCLGVILRETQQIEIECGHLDYSIVPEPKNIIESAWSQIEQTLEANTPWLRQPEGFEQELTTFKIKTLYYEFNDSLCEDREIASVEELSERAVAQVAEILKMSPDDIRTVLGPIGPSAF